MKNQKQQEGTSDPEFNIEDYTHHQGEDKVASGRLSVPISQKMNPALYLCYDLSSKQSALPNACTP
jgi:hypothetical protein